MTYSGGANLLLASFWPSSSVALSGTGIILFHQARAQNQDAVWAGDDGWRLAGCRVGESVGFLVPEPLGTLGTVPRRRQDAAQGKFSRLGSKDDRGIAPSLCFRRVNDNCVITTLASS